MLFKCLVLEVSKGGNHCWSMLFLFMFINDLIMKTEKLFNNILQPCKFSWATSLPTLYLLNLSLNQNVSVSSSKVLTGTNWTRKMLMICKLLTYNAVLIDFSDINSKFCWSPKHRRRSLTWKTSKFVKTWGSDLLKELTKFLFKSCSLETSDKWQENHKADEVIGYFTKPVTEKYTKVINTRRIVNIILRIFVIKSR